jgi:diguanylate cyclase (GGDEF)-like protein
MPGLDGFELTEKAKKLRPDMAVIIMTGFIDDFSYDRALEAGAFDFIKKPFTVTEMKMRLRHVTLREKLLEASVTDEVTGLFNRKGFITLAEQQLKLARRYKKGIFILYATLDNVNAVGHREGERALIDTATILRTTYREADIVARTGENEFVVIPVGFGGDNVEAIAACLRENLDHYNAEKKLGYKLSLSFGVTYYDPENPLSVDELLASVGKSAEEQKKGARKS